MDSVLVCVITYLFRCYRCYRCYRGYRCYPCVVLVGVLFAW